MITIAKKSNGMEEKKGGGGKVCVQHRGINVSSASLFYFYFGFMATLMIVYRCSTFDNICHC